MKAPAAADRKPAIFSGPASVAMWDAIGEEERGAGLTAGALYQLGCKCQELEALVRRLAARVEDLEARR